VSFDRTDSDGCMSTNDSVYLLASGASGVTPDYDDFRDGLTEVCCSLAQQLIADAEGAEHEIAINVTGAATEEDALDAARTIGRSNLVKCAIAGNQPYWGRIMAALGTCQAAFDPGTLELSLNGVTVFAQGEPADPAETVDLTPRHTDITVDLHAGHHEATIWTNDLTHGYVTENAEYAS
jgi:glutamate N-acetyltransferase/amino-acid N-acetyltransferase